MTPEEIARQQIDEKLTQAGWLVQDRKEFDRFAGDWCRLPRVCNGRWHGSGLSIIC